MYFLPGWIPTEEELGSSEESGKDWDELEEEAAAGRSQAGTVWPQVYLFLFFKPNFPCYLIALPHFDAQAITFTLLGWF